MKSFYSNFSCIVSYSMLTKEKKLVVFIMLLLSAKVMQEFKPKFLHPFYTWKTVAYFL